MALGRELRLQAGFGSLTSSKTLSMLEPLAGSGGLAPLGLLGADAGKSAVRNRTVQVGAFTHAFLSSFLGPAGRGRPYAQSSVAFAGTHVSTCNFFLKIDYARVTATTRHVLDNPRAVRW